MQGERRTGIAVCLLLPAAFAAMLVTSACSSDRSVESALSPQASPTTGGERFGNSSDAPVFSQGVRSVAATIGPAGGTLELASGPRVEIPAGALDQTQEIVLKEAPVTTAFSNQEHERPHGPTFVVGPALDAPPGKSVRVSVPLASYPDGWGDVALGREYPVQQMVGADEAEHTKWEYAAARLSSGRAVADLPGLNGYRLQFVLSNLAAQ